MNLEEYYELYLDGYDELQKQRKIEEAAKAPALRGGNSGALLADGRFIGDPREAVLRYLGVETEPSFATNLLFQAGHFNEDAMCDLLEAAGQKFLREEHCPVTWTTKNGFLVTGRPDIMVLNEQDKELDDPTATFTGVEAKGIFSGWSALKQAHWGYGKPKDIYICQSAHYFYKTIKTATNWVVHFSA